LRSRHSKLRRQSSVRSSERAVPPGGAAGGVLALAAIFLPAFLLVVGALPYWEALRRNLAARRALSGVNAAVVGILLAALYDPVWTSSVRSIADLAVALVAFALLAYWKAPPLVAVGFAALGGALLLA
jgi:chromate transporter